MIQPSGSQRHPIQVVARRTGLTVAILRAWEKRYAAVAPDRTAGDRRLYSEDDIERLLLLRRAIQGGHSIGQVARRPTAELKALVASDEAAAQRLLQSDLDQPGRVGREAREEPAPPRSAEEYLVDCLDAVRDLDAPGLEKILGRATTALSRHAMIDKVLAPLLQRVGDGWHDGSLRIAHEHLASAAVRSFVGQIASQGDLPATAPRLVVGTPARQLHEIAALFAAVTAASEGWRPIYLGANLPAEEIAAASGQCGARGVALSITYPGDDPLLADELRRLRRLMPRGTAILVGGESAVAYAPALKDIGAKPLADMPALRVALRTLRGPARRR
jgi:DNA-binding transcriptional MerR regulator/methylmalonyl-CoA mutase cobalamin-binding subunit